MAEGLGFSQPGESLQRLARSYREYTDQHNRKFGAQAEVSNGCPVGELVPLGFVPPWQPPMRFAKFAGLHATTFRWDYEEIASELGGVTANWYQMVIAWAIENNKPEPEVGGPVDRSIRYGYGIPPLSPAIPLACELGDAWILGTPGAPVNKMLKAILEQTSGASGKEAIDFIKSKLAERATGSEVPLVASTPFVPTIKEVARTINSPDAIDPNGITYTEFVKACAGRKMNIKDIADAWAEHKKNLAADVAQVA